MTCLWMVIQKGVQRREIGGAHSGTMLDLDGHEAPPGGKHQITLKALRCSPEVGFPRHAKMPKELPNFHDSERLEKSAEMGSTQEPTPIPNSLEMKGKSHVGEYPFWPAYQPLGSSDVMAGIDTT